MSQPQRRLAAIMYTDMVGYTALGQKNESLSLALVEEQRKLLRPVFNRHSGREVKTMGDAFLVEFQSALDAVRCAYDIQRAVRELNISLSPEQRVHLRVGVHLGDVVESQGDISGDAVNVASRIQALAEDGGVCVTRQVRDQVENKFQLPLTGLGTRSLKNVDRPVDLYKMVMPWEPGTAEEKPTPVSAAHRLAVLPFANISPDPNDEFFADGLTEEMITQLSGLSGLGVIARTSVMHYKNSGKGVREIARDLGVGSVLEGSIRKAGNKIRITAQLVDGRNEEHLWAQRFDRDLNDIFAVQSEIAESVAKALELKLVPKNKPAKASPEDLDAYALCLKARFYWNRRSKEGIDQAIQLFHEALKIDPDSARANAGLADCYIQATSWGYIDTSEGESKTSEYIAKALKLDDALPDAHATLGFALSMQKKDREAEAELRKALTLNPNYASAHLWYSVLLRELGRMDEGLAEITKAVELDPLSPIINLNLAWHFWFTERLEDAMMTLNRIVQTEPGFPYSYRLRSLLHAMKGRRKEAVADLEMLYKLTGVEYRYKLASALVEALLGNREEALRLVQEAVPLMEEKTGPRGYAQAYAHAYFVSTSPHLVYATLGDRDQFFKWVDWAIERNLAQASDLKYSPLLKEMRKEPRFAELYKSFNLPE